MMRMRSNWPTLKNMGKEDFLGIDTDFDYVEPIAKKDCNMAEPAEEPYVEAGVPICYGAWQRVEMEIKWDTMKKPKKSLDTGYENE